jgi:hypothetical protein
MLSHDSLYNYYTLNFSLRQFHNYSLTELDNMIPWEREIYVGQLVQHIRHETEMAHLRAHQNKG